MSARKKPPATPDDQLRAAVAARGLSGCELARLAGVDHRSVGRWLAGTQGLSWSTAAAIIAALGLRLR
jgi:transcriptional regulator with XRE-family HTH domain